LRLTKSSALAWLVVALAPFLISVFFLGQIAISGEPERARTSAYLDITPMLIFVAIVTFAIAGSFISYAQRSPTVPSSKRTLWSVLLLFGNVFAVPVFWFLYIWRPLHSRRAP